MVLAARFSIYLSIEASCSFIYDPYKHLNSSERHRTAFGGPRGEARPASVPFDMRRRPWCLDSVAMLLIGAVAPTALSAGPIAAHSAHGNWRIANAHIANGSLPAADVSRALDGLQVGSQVGSQVGVRAPGHPQPRSNFYFAASSCPSRFGGS